MLGGSPSQAASGAHTNNGSNELGGGSSMGPSLFETTNSSVRQIGG